MMAWKRYKHGLNTYSVYKISSINDKTLSNMEYIRSFLGFTLCEAPKKLYSDDATVRMKKSDAILVQVSIAYLIDINC
jgi:hypothetical protein